MAVLVDITDFSPRAARNSAARGVSVLLSGIPFYLKALDSYASWSVFLMQHDVRIPLPDSPVIEDLPYAIWLKAIRMRIHGHFMPPPRGLPFFTRAACVAVFGLAAVGADGRLVCHAVVELLPFISADRTPARLEALPLPIDSDRG